MDLDATRQVHLSGPVTYCVRWGQGEGGFEGQTLSKTMQLQIAAATSQTEMGSDSAFPKLPWTGLAFKTMNSPHPVFIKKLHLDADVAAESFELVLVFRVSLLSIRQFLCRGGVSDARRGLQRFQVRPIRIKLHSTTNHRLK